METGMTAGTSEVIGMVVFSTGDRPVNCITERQRRYISSLSLKLDKELPRHLHLMSRREASIYVERLLDENGRRRA